MLKTLKLIKDLESKLNEQIEKNVNLTKEVNDSERTNLVAEVSADLADTEKEKFASMAENVEFESAPKFREKLETIKESYQKIDLINDEIDKETFGGFHDMMLEHYESDNQITFFVPKDEKQYTLDELTDILI